MLKSLQKGLSKFFTNDKIMLLLVLAILAFAIYSYGMQKDFIRDNMTEGNSSGDDIPEEEREWKHLNLLKEPTLEQKKHQLWKWKWKDYFQKPKVLIPAILPP